MERLGSARRLVAALIVLLVAGAGVVVLLGGRREAPPSAATEPRDLVGQSQTPGKPKGEVPVQKPYEPQVI